jgi:putative membrane protein
MKRTFAISAALAAALSLAACGERNEPVEDGPIEDASAKSGVGSNEASNAVQDAAAEAVGAASAATAGRTTGGYVPAAAISDMYEIEAGRIAGEKAQHADLKAFAKMLVTDHTKSSGEMKTAAGSAQGVQMPSAMDERRQGLIDNLKQASAQDFDKVFINQQVAAHEEALTLHRTYAENGDNAALKAFAAKTAPIIQAHHQRAEQLQQAVMGGGAQAGGAAAKH